MASSSEVTSQTSSATNCTSSVIEGFCYTVLDSSQLETALWLSAVGGALVLIAWAYLRGSATWRPIYHKRTTQILDLCWRPPPLRLTGLSRLYGYLIPIFTLSDGDLLRTAGFDALILVRFMLLGMHIFLPLTILASAVLLPTYRTGGALLSASSSTSSNTTSSGTVANTDSSMLYTLSNIEFGSSRLWAPFVVMLAFNAYCMLVLRLHYRSYAVLSTLRVHGLHSTTLLGDGGPGFPSDSVVYMTNHRSTAAAAVVVGSKSESETSSILKTFPPCGAKDGGSGDNNENKEKDLGNAASAWNAVLSTALCMLSPWYMYQRDLRFVKHCLEALQLSLAAAPAHRHPRAATGSIPASVPPQITETVSRNKSVSTKPSSSIAEATIRTKKDEIDLDPMPCTGTCDGFKVDANDRLPCSGVTPWWLLPESPDLPEAINPTLARGGAVLIGKTNPQLRSRVAAATTDGIQVWAPAASYVVLFRGAGSTTAPKWDMALDVGGSDALSGSDGTPDDAASIDVPHASAHASTVSIRPSTSSTKQVKRHNRISALESALKMLFPSEFVRMVHVYPHKEADRAVQSWDQAAAELERTETALAALDPKETLVRKKAGEGVVIDEEAGLARDVDVHRRGTGGEGCSGSRDATNAAVRSTSKEAQKQAQVQLAAAKLLQHRLQQQERCKEAEAAVVAARCRALKTPLGTVCFALFSSQRAALTALRSGVGAVPQINMEALPAPGPDEINWEGLWAGHAERVNRLVWLVIPCMVLIMLFPIGALTGALTNLNIALCGGTEETNDVYSAGFCQLGALKFIITTFVPVIISTWWDTWVLPLLFYLLCQAQRSLPSFSSLDMAVTRAFFGFAVVNTFAGAILGGAALQQLGSALKSGNIFDLIGTAVPGVANFFMNYIATHALFTNVFRFIWPHDGTVLFVFFRAIGLHRPKCPRDEYIIRMAPSYRGGRHYGAFLAIYVMALGYSVVAPLILPLALLFFFTAWMTWRYSAIHFYQPCYEGNGRIFELLFQLMLWTLWVADFFTGCVLIASRGVGFWLGGILLIISTIAVPLYHGYCYRYIGRHLSSVPLQATVSAPTAVVPVEAYLPPPLRTGAVGWTPEWGKPWEKYGLPRYSSIW